MPSTSKKQHNFMAAIAHNPAFAKKVGVPQSVGKDFNQADKGRKFGGGGMAKDMESKSEMRKEEAADKKQDVAMIKKAFKEHDAQEHKGGKGTKISLKKGGVAMTETMGPKTMSMDVEKGSNKLTKFGESAVQKRGKTKGTNMGDSGPTVAPKTMKMAKGGMCGGGKAAKRYDEGGDVETETMQGKNENIGDDTRARAMAAIAAGGQKEEAAPASKPKAASFKSKAKKAGFTSAETGGGAALMTRKMAKGGSASSRADGCAQRGKTRI